MDFIKYGIYKVSTLYVLTRTAMRYFHNFTVYERITFVANLSTFTTRSPPYTQALFCVQHKFKIVICTVFSAKKNYNNDDCLGCFIANLENMNIKFFAIFFRLSH